MDIKYGIFPNTSTVAHYNSLGQFITLSKYEEKPSLEKLNSDIIDDNKIDLLCTLSHELHHWLDHVSTVWGLKNLISIYNSFNCYLLQNEYEFWRIARLMKNFQRDSYSQYYHTKFRDFELKDINERWLWQISTGLKFNTDGFLDENKPILFVRFQDRSRNDLSRTPVSILSILETNSMNKEFRINSSYILSKKNDPVDFKIRNDDFRAKQLGWLYNSDLTEYSVIAHLVSLILEITDIGEALSIASTIGTIVLNIPNELIANIPITHNYDILSTRIKTLIKNCDPGTIFLNLLYNYKASYKQTKMFDLEKFLENSNLPTLTEFDDIVYAYTSSLRKDIIKGPLKYKIIKLFENGLQVLKKRGASNQNPIDLEYLFDLGFMPTILWGDTYFDTDSIDENNLFRKLLSNQTIDFWEWHKLQEILLDKFKLFGSVCGL